jgi:hypothetical protein
MKRLQTLRKLSWIPGVRGITGTLSQVRNRLQVKKNLTTRVLNIRLIFSDWIKSFLLIENKGFFSVQIF